LLLRTFSLSARAVARDAALTFRFLSCPPVDLACEEDVEDAGDEAEVSTMPLFWLIFACVETEIFDVLIGI
jgi:hypothetical protein